MSITGPLPDNILRRMAPEDRPRGPAGRTAQETLARGAESVEKEIQRQIAAWLSRHDVEFINPPMHRRSMLPEGWPDFSFVLEGVPWAIEVKVPGGNPRPEQSARMERLRANGWSVAVCHSLADFLRVAWGQGLTKPGESESVKTARSTPAQASDQP